MIAKGNLHSDGAKLAAYILTAEMGERIEFGGSRGFAFYSQDPRQAAAARDLVARQAMGGDEVRVECLDGCYSFDHPRLLEGLLDPEHPHSWPLHVAGKTWVDVDEFTTAWMVAIVLRGYGSKKIAAAIRRCFGDLPPWGADYEGSRRQR